MSRHYVTALEARVQAVHLIHWRGVVGREIQARCDALRTHMAVNLISAEQRAGEQLEMTDKLGVVTGNLQGEMHTHNLTLDALEHEVLLLESQIVNSGIVGGKKKSSRPPTSPSAAA